MKMTVGSSAPGVAPAAQPSITDEELTRRFTRSIGGPNPMYRCNGCGYEEYGVRNLLVDHARACGVAIHAEYQQFIRLLDAALHHARASHAVRERTDSENVQPIHDEADRARKAVIEYVTLGVLGKEEFGKDGKTTKV